MSEYDETTTTDDVLNGRDLSGFRVLVTGNSSGLGLETSRSLLAHGADVVGAVRDLEKAKSASGVLSDAAAKGGGSFEFIELDLASLDSVRAATDALNEKGQRFDAVIANAGVMATPFEKTADGFELQFGTNHLGHFAFVNRVAPMIKKGGKVVVLSSAAHRFSNVDLEDPNFDETPYDTWDAYGRSKTANVLFAVEFDRRYKEAGIRAAAVHPGGSDTNLDRHMTQADKDAMVARINSIAKAQTGGPAFKLKTAAQAAATSVWLAVVADGNEIGGKFCADCSVAGLAHGEKIGRGVREYAIDPDSAKALWTLSEDMIGEQF